MDSLDIDKELKRHATCADELYTTHLKLPLNSKDDIMRWTSSLRNIIARHNLTPLSDYIDGVEHDLLQADDYEQQRAIKTNFTKQLQEFFDDRKAQLSEQHTLQQTRMNQYFNGHFKVEYSPDDCLEHIYIDDIELEYIPPANEPGRQNYQWRPLLIAFIKSPTHMLNNINIETVIHTSTDRATRESIRKLVNILKANYDENKSKHINTSRFRIRKYRSTDSWILEKID